MISGSPVRRIRPCAAAVAIAKQSASAIGIGGFQAGHLDHACLAGKLELENLAEASRHPVRRGAPVVAFRAVVDLDQR